MTVRILDLPNVIKHAFMSGFAAGKAKGTDVGSSYIDYDPTECAAFERLADHLADHLAPPFDFRAHLERQAEWSAKTFGPGARAAGVVDHIRKELREIEADPNDLTEWIDVVILALDGAWRMGYSPDEIIEALVAKQAKNEARNWPDWRTAEPGKAIEHIKEDGE